MIAGQQGGWREECFNCREYAIGYCWKPGDTKKVRARQFCKDFRSKEGEKFGYWAEHERGIMFEPLEYRDEDEKTALYESLEVGQIFKDKQLLSDLDRPLWEITYFQKLSSGYSQIKTGEYKPAPLEKLWLVVPVTLLIKEKGKE